MGSELTITELKKTIEERYERLKELYEQDESQMSDFLKNINGKEVNIPLVKNHIIYFKRQLDNLKSGGLNKWL